MEKKPCPVCGGTDIGIRAFKYGFDVYYKAECNHCKLKDAHWTEEEAIQAWNNLLVDLSEIQIDSIPRPRSWFDLEEDK